MSTVRRVTLAVSLAAMVVTGIAIGQIAGAEPRARSTVHSVTVRGMDFRSLDFRVFPQLIPNTGGGIYPAAPFGTAPQPAYLEADVELPPGASVNQVTFYYRDCGAVAGTFVPLLHSYLFAYDPVHAGGSYILPAADSPAKSCSTTVPFVRPVSPPVKVVASRVYAVGVDTGYVVMGDSPTTTPDALIAGARVRYTCPNAC
jgi:hypothetical protein